MAPGGTGYHLIDFVDRTTAPTDYHWWSFLAEEEDWPHKECNRLRASEMRDIIDAAGFEVLKYSPISQEPLPSGFRKQLKGRFAEMSDEELSVLRVACVMKKPKVEP